MYQCPVLGCDYTADNVDALAGHIGSMQDRDDLHADYGEINRWRLFDFETDSPSL
jgi:hypothetical protein